MLRDGAEDYWSASASRTSSAAPPCAGALPSLDVRDLAGRRDLPLHAQSDSKNLMICRRSNDGSSFRRSIKCPASRPRTISVITREFVLDSIQAELCAFGVGINDVINAINNNSANAGGGGCRAASRARGPRRGWCATSTTSAIRRDPAQQRADHGPQGPRRLELSTRSPKASWARTATCTRSRASPTSPNTRTHREVLAGIHAKVAMRLNKQFEPQDRSSIVPYIDRSNPDRS